MNRQPRQTIFLASIRDIFRQIFVISCLAVLMAPRASADDIRFCNGKWTNQACDGAASPPPPAGSASVFEAKGEPVSDPPILPPSDLGEGSAQSAPNAVTNSSADTREVKVLKKDRPDPNMEWKRDEITISKWRFSGKLKGNGKTRVSLIISKASYTGRVSREYPAFNKIFELPPWGGETDFSFVVDVPAPERSWNWKWFLRAEYIGRWDGFRDFRGCCPQKDEEAFCDKSGNVICRGNISSTSCKCY